MHKGASRACGGCLTPAGPCLPRVTATRCYCKCCAKGKGPTHHTQRGNHHDENDCPATQNVHRVQGAAAWLWCPAAARGASNGLDVARQPAQSATAAALEDKTGRGEPERDALARHDNPIGED